MTEVTDRLAGLSAEKRRLLEARLRMAKQPAPPAADGPELRPRARPDGTAPASFAQRRMWLIERMEPGTSAWNIPLALRLRGPLDAAALERALDSLRARHESLRTTFAERGDEPVQVVHPFAPIALPVDDLSGLGPEEREAELRRRVHAETNAGFGLEAGPLFRARLIRLGADDHLLALAMHHIVSDGWSMGVLHRELEALYAAYAAGRPDPLPPVALQYADFAAWQREWLAGERLDASLAWWRRALEDASPALELPTDRPRPATESHRGARREIEVSAATARGLRELALREGATLFAVLLAAARVVLARWSGQDDLVIGTPALGRLGVETEGVVGCFVNTLALRTKLEGEPTFAALVRRERDGVLDAFAHQELPFERVVEELKVPRDAARHPVFQVMLSLQNLVAEEPRLAGLTVEAEETGIVGAKVDLAFEAHETGDTLTVVADYAVDLFEAATVDRILAHLLRVLDQAAADAARPVSRIELVDADEAAAIAAWSAAPAVDPRATTLVARFLAQARATPGATAVVSRGGEATYAELEAASARIARRLRALGVGAEGVVGAFVGWGPETPAALLGVMRSGGVWLPLDPALPPARVAWMLGDAGARVVITTRDLRGRIDTDLPLVVVDEVDDGAGDGALDAVDAGGLAYVVYTSGSTGTPKAVAVEHGAAAAHVLAAAEAYGVTADDRMLGFASLSFDPSLEQMLVPLASGASLAVRDAELWSPAELAEALPRLGVTVANLPTPFFHELVRESTAAGAVKTALRLLVVGGEALRLEAAAAWQALPGACRLTNAYGPTETLVTATLWPVPQDFAADANVAIGSALPGREPRVLDAALRPVAIGVPGELFLGGGALARGYLRRPALTAERFVPDPFARAPGARMYRTGDRARWRNDGALEFLGRVDDQVKIHGVRVEPGEVEAALRALPEVAECAVGARAGARGEPRLVAWVRPRGAFDSAAIRAGLAGRIPAWLVPAAVVAVEALPRTPAGKIDRRALPDPPAETASAAPATLTPDEELLAGIWAEVLGAERVGAHDDFFELGGHSLLATQVVSRVRRTFAVELPLRVMFEAPTLRGLARRIARLRAAGEGAPMGPIPRAERSAPLPLSFAQERLWFIDQLEPGSAAYNAPLALDLRGPLDIAALERALGEIVRRHEPLRTVFAATDDAPMQVIQPFAGFRLPVVEGDVDAIVAAQARRPFDLARGPLLRATLIRAGDERHTLLLVMHHVVSDAWSAGVLFRELTAIYAAFVAGEDAPLAELAVQYADFAAWQRQWLRGDVLARQAAFWKRRLAGAPAVLELPTDRPRPAVQDLRGALLPFALSAGASGAVRTLARREGATPFMVLLAAFSAVLHRWSGEEDLVIGTPIANRTRPELEPLIGFFDNTLALRTDLSGDPGFAALLGRVREATLEAYAHQDIPFERLVDELKVERSLSHAPLFQVMLTLQNAPGGALSLGPVEIEPRAADTGTSRFDLTLILADDGEGGLGGWAEFATALWDESTIRRMTRHLDALLRAAAASPGEPISTLPLLSADERAEIVARSSGEVHAAPFVAAHERVAAQAVRTPDAAAIEHGGERITYAELEARANRLAHRLRRMGVGPDARVAVAMERSIDLVVSVLAVLKAGGCYVPVDPGYPADRVAYMLAGSGARVVLTTSAVAPRLPSTAAAVLQVDAEREEIAAESADAPRVDLHPENLLYVIYTSGSTGRPKGAALPHRALATLLRWQLARWGDGAAARTLQFTSLSFDVSFQEIFATWAAGGTLVLVDDETRRDGEALLAYLRAHRVERLFLPFAALQNLAEAAEGGDRGQGTGDSRRISAHLPHLREVITAGEALRSTPQLRDFFRANPGCALENQYGPSETHVVSAHEVEGAPEGWPALPPIGSPIEGTRLYVLDRHLRPVDDGIPGELYAGGECLGRGYLGRPALTAERFVPDPLSGIPGARLYRTGDRVRRHADGVLEYVGRTDFQVKVRGFRVEPGEVEAALTEHPSVVQAAVAARGEGAAKRLSAWVVPAAGAEVSVPALRAHLAGRLPEYMVPTAWRVMESLPLTPSGKVDRRALPDADAVAAAAHVPPRTPAERLVADAWESVLGVRPGAHDDFFELGGHSLRATQVMGRIRRAFGVDLPLRALFEAPTVAGLAERAAGARRGGELELPPLVAAPRGRTSPLSFAQQRFWFVERTGVVGGAYTMAHVYHLRGALDAAALERALNGVVARHESLRTTFRFEGGEPVQVVAPELFIPLPRIDLAAMPEREAEARALAREHAAAPFHLAAGPLARWTLLRLGEGEHRLLLDLHHVVADGWSIGVLQRELGELYAAEVEGRAPNLPPLPIQYADFARWQRERLDGPVLEHELAWWRERLEGAPTLSLPTDRAHPPVQSFRGDAVHFAFTADQARRLGALARGEGATPYMAMLALFSVLLARWSGTEDVVIGSPAAGRVPQETEGLIGVFLNTLALRADLSGDPTFREALRRVRETAVDAYAHQEVPFERLVEELKVERSLSAHPVYQVMFAWQSEIAAAPPAFPGVEVEIEEGETSTAKLDLMLAAGDDGDGIRAVLEYAADLFDRATIERMAEHLRVLLDAATADPDRRVSDLPLMPPAEAALVLETFNDTARAYPTGLCLHDLLEAQAARTPDAVAVTGAGESLTYAALDARANRLANRLRALGVGPEVRVAVCMERTPDLVVALYGVLKAGGAYVPVDPAYPADRIGFMVAESGAPVVLTHASLAPSIPATDARLLRMDADRAEVDAAPATRPESGVEERNLAYVIYTSGSTGRPKGVQIEHRSAVALCHWLREHISDGERTAVLASTSVSFDVSIAEIFGTLSWGGRIVLVRDALAVRGLDQPVTLGSMAPSAAAELLRTGDVPPSLRRLDLGGEALPPSLAAGLHALGTLETVGNYYGPTEDTTYSTWWFVPPGAPKVYVGRAAPNKRMYVLDSRLRPVPLGAVGELWIAGDGLSRGYHGRPGMTAARFRPDPFAKTPGARMYRVGDRIRWLTDGTLEYLGRTDYQVKVRGHRVEPGEVEAVLAQHPLVREAVVAVRGEGVEARLVAWVVPAREAAPAAELRAWLRTRLPAWMVPGAFVEMETLPLSPNGKVDRDRLPDPAPERPADPVPGTELEREIARVWQEVLGVARVGLDENFFEIGGHSLLLARVQERLRESTGREVGVIDLFQFSTVRALAEHLDARDRPADAETEPAAAPGVDRAALRREMLRRGRR